ncbi:hypothetical protein PAE9249_01725 [Paenibacillus sp. CECT 9249]|nr:hypothetical protein PAE9249_01725 [Paenibacillus sp. CECT 9249]
MVKRYFRKYAMSLLACLLLFTTLPQGMGLADGLEASRFKDLPANHWAGDAMRRWTELGVIQGYGDGTVRPNENVSRAQFAAIMNRMLGLQGATTEPIADAPSATWYGREMAKAVKAGYLMLDGERKSDPHKSLSRAEAALAFEILFNFGHAKHESGYMFTDVGSLNPQTVEAIGALAASGYVQGYGDGTFRPDRAMTRAELVAIVDRMIGLLANEAGERTGGDVASNAIVARAGVILKDSVIDGNLYITEGIGTGEVTLQRITVKGTTYINGGRVVNLNDSRLSGVEVNATDGKERTLHIAGHIGKLVLNGKTKVVLADGAVVSELIVNEQAQGTIIEGSGNIDSLINHAQHVYWNGKAVTSGQNESPGKTPGAASSGSGSSGSSGGSGGGGGGSPQRPMWTLVWSDEFEGAEIDRGKWTFDIGNGEGGWGNNELEYYTDRPENVKVENGALVITARKEAYEGFDYTSTRIKTKGKYSQKYGKFEIRAKAPAGKGYWPAIWMMPEHDAYGTWASSGEIDIMEGWGSMPHKVGGTIHYGGNWPNNTYSGKEYEFPNGGTIEDYHVYSIEWEPGEIRWYVDGQLYSTQNDWYSRSLYQPANNTYPAPFDQPFHLIMNLAIGGHFDGNPDDSTLFPKTMEIDYVRMYELTGRPYREPKPPVIPKEDLPPNAKMPLPDGNLVYNGSFDEDEPDVPNLDDVPNTDYWRLFRGEGGAGSVQIDRIGDANYLKMNIASPGTQPYSVQLLQDVSVAKGRYYQLSFDAKTTSARDIGVKVTGGEARGFAAYSPSSTLSLTGEFNRYELQFQMKQDTDIAARIEFNAGLNGDPVWIGNVRMEEIDGIEYDRDAPKTPLSGDGNHIYNGTFDQGDPDRMTYWHVYADSGAEATASVSEAERRLRLNIANPGDGSKQSVRLSQKGLYLIEGQDYKLTFDASATTDRTIEIELASKDGMTSYGKQTVALDPSFAPRTASFSMPNATDREAQIVFHLGGAKGTVTMDNIKLIRTSAYYDPELEFYPLVNGGFDRGLESWEVIAVDGAIAGSVVDGEAKLQIANRGSAPHGNLMIQSGLKLASGIDYILEFDARSTANRKMQVTVENAGYFRYFDQIVDLTKDMKRYRFEFRMTRDETVDLKFLLGKIAGDPDLNAHDLFLDNVVLEVKDAPVQRPPALYAEPASAGRPIAITFADREEWRQAVTKVKINGTALQTGEYQLQEGVLTFAADCFPEPGTYTVAVEAEGYAHARVKQTIIAESGNLIRNGDWSGGNEHWSHWAGNGGASVFTVEDGAAKLDITAIGTENWTTQLFQEGIPLQAGKTYELRFKAWSTADRPIRVEFTNTSPVQDAKFDITGDRQLVYTRQFTAAQNVSLKLNFCVGNVVNGAKATPDERHAVYFDDVELTEVDGGGTNPDPVEGWIEVGDNAIENGTFDSGLDGWKTHNQGDYEEWAGDANITADNGQAKVEIAAEGWDWWHIQFYQEPVSVTSGTYKIAFDMRSDYSRPIYVELVDSGAPKQTFTVDQTMKTYEAIIRVGNDGSYKFMFGFGRNDSDAVLPVPYNIDIDNIKLVRVERDGSGI